MDKIPPLQTPPLRTRISTSTGFNDECEKKSYEVLYRITFDSDNFRMATKDNIELLELFKKMGNIIGFEVSCRGLKQR